MTGYSGSLDDAERIVALRRIRQKCGLVASDMANDLFSNGFINADFMLTDKGRAELDGCDRSAPDHQGTG